MQQKDRLFCLCAALAALLLGLAVYLAAGADNRIGALWQSLGLPHFFRPTGPCFVALRSWGCDGLWAGALVFVLAAVLAPKTRRGLLFLGLGCCSYCTAVELLQLAGVFAGVFDVWDIAAQAAGVAAAVWVIQRRRKLI